MLHLEISLFAVAFLVSVCSAGMFYSHLKVHEESYVRSLSVRSRRDVDKTTVAKFPEYMIFILTLDGRKTRIELKLNEHQDDHVPVKLFHNGEFTVYNDSSSRDYAFYQQINSDNKAAVRVGCKAGRSSSCHIIGHIRVGDNDYKIEPKSHEAKLVAKVKHVVYKVDKNGEKGPDFTGDTNTFTVDDSNLESNPTTTETIRTTLDQSTPERTRQKRQILNRLQIEIELVIDYSVYSFWLKREDYNEDAAIRKIKEYCELMVNDMDTRYLSAATSDMTIEIIPLEITIIQDLALTTWITGNEVINGWINASTALDSFQQWAETNRRNLGKYDAIMAVTMRDLASYNVKEDKYKNGTAGLAYKFSRKRASEPARPLALPCRRLQMDNTGLFKSYAVSIIEGMNGDDAHTAAHELAHNLGVTHDMLAGCSFYDQYIMSSGRYKQFVAAAEPGNHWQFSPCSKAIMSESLQDLLEDGKTCLKERSYSIEDYNRIVNGPLSGSVYTINDQCELALGGGSRFCSGLTPNKETMCHTGAYCTIPWMNGYCRNMFVMDGTDCGNAGENKVCQQGFCKDVADTTTEASTTTTTPTTTTTTPTTTTTTPTITTTTPTTTTTTPTTATTTPTTTTTTPTTATTTTTTTTTTTPSTTTTTPTTTTTTPTTTITIQAYTCDIYCKFCCYLYNTYHFVWSWCPSWITNISSQCYNVTLK